MWVLVVAIDVSWVGDVQKVLPDYFWLKNSDEKIMWLRDNFGLSLRDAFTVLKVASSV